MKELVWNFRGKHERIPEKTPHKKAQLEAFDYKVYMMDKDSSRREDGHDNRTSLVMHLYLHASMAKNSCPLKLRVKGDAALCFNITNL